MAENQTSTPRPLPLRERHLGLGARFGDFAGWEMPLWYGGAVEEHLAVRQGAGVFDISHMGRFLAEGPEAASVLASLFTRDPGVLAINASAYAFACNDAGGIIDDLIYYRRGDDSYLVICNAANADAIGQAITAASSGKEVTITTLTAETVLLAVQGPTAVDATAAIIGEAVRDIARRTSGSIVFDGREFLLARTGYTGEDGFEVMATPEDGAWLLDQLLKAGVVPAGLAARDTLRLEVALALHGHEIDETTTPWEAGLSWAVSLEHQFRGRDALVAAKDATTRRLACIVADGPGIIRAGYAIYQGDTLVGSLTSGGHSPMLSKSIGMGYLPRALTKPGTELSIELRGRRIPAHTVKRPFYSPPSQE